MEKKSEQKKNRENKMQAQAILRYLRIAPRKMRLVANIIKRKPVNEAEAQLMLHARRAAQPILKLLRSAIANAKNKKMDVTKLFVSDVRVDQGPMLKRWMPRAQGRATPIHKNTSHVIIVLQEGEKSVQSRFVTETKKVKKEKKEKAHEHAHEHEHEAEEPKTKPVKEPELKKETKAPQKGFVQKMFRRKSV